MPATLNFHDDNSAHADCDTLLVIGRKQQLLGDDVRSRLPDAIDPSAGEARGEATDGGDDGRCDGQ